MPELAANVFVSYSHLDAPLVGPVVSLLRATNATVFRDADTIRLGKKWREELTLALEHANLVVLFWCHHSKASSEVRKEYDLAVRLGKDLLPIRLDDAPLPPVLAQYQSLDFRGVVRQCHSDVAQVSPISVIVSRWRALIRSAPRRSPSVDHQDFENTGASNPPGRPTFRSTGAFAGEAEVDQSREAMARLIQGAIFERLGRSSGA